MPRAPRRDVTSTAEALALFDSLPAVECSDLHGRWQGATFPTGHALDDALERYGWQGKRFDSDEEAHPLLFGVPGNTFSVDPRWVAPGLPLLLRWPALKSRIPAAIVRSLLPLFATRRPRGRLRMVRHRGVVSATLVYDHLPIQDVFRRRDATTLLGLMDRKGMAVPFFFVLRRVG